MLTSPKIDRLVTCLKAARASSGRPRRPPVRTYKVLTAALSLGAHACIAAVMRHVLLCSSPDTFSHMQLSRGQNAQVAVKVSFIEPQPSRSPDEEPTDTPQPQVPFEHMKSMPPEIPVLSARVRLAQPAEQPAIRIDAIELEVSDAKLEVSVMEPKYRSAPIRRIESAMPSVAIPDAIGLDLPRRPIETTTKHTSDPGVIEGAAPTQPISPEYPSTCIRRGQQGTVILEVCVLVAGRAGEITVFKSSGYAKLDAAAVAAIRMARFAPARKSGRSIESRIKIPVRFVLK